MRKMIAAMALIAGAALPVAATVAEPVAVHASSINDMAKQNSYGGITYLEQMLQEAGIKYNNFSAQNPLKYRNGKPEGVVIHETATPGASAYNEAIYFNREWMNIYSYVHAFVDKTGVIQMMEPDYGVWGAGPIANNRFFQVELCEENNLSDFAKSINNDAIYVAQIMLRYNLVPDNAVHDGKGTVWSHRAVSQFLGGTDHGDPDGYFAKWGYSMDDFYDLIKYYYDNGAITSGNTGTGNTKPVEKPVVPTKPAIPAKPKPKPTVTKPTGTAALPKPIGTRLLMHNALVYDENGTATKLPSKKAGTNLTVYGTKTIKGKKYFQVGSNQYVVATNVEGTLQLLKSNAYFYDKDGNRIGKSKLKRGNYVRTYGSRVRIHGKKYYTIDNGQFIKVGNFK